MAGVAARPAPASPLKLDEFHLGPQQRLEVLALLGVADVARWACASRAAGSDLSGIVGELLWSSIYDSTQRLQDPASEDIRALVARPCGEAAVGCRVSVYSAARDAYLGGMIQAFDVRWNAYLVHYDDPPGEDGVVEIWEVDARRDAAARRNPSLQSQSRFRFLTLPEDAEARTFTGWGASSCSSSSAGADDGFRMPQELRLGSWREELRHTVRHTPRRRRATIQDHTDEVLFVTFSPCGRLLATCSRDRRTGIFRMVDGAAAPERVAMLVHDSTALRAHWWPEYPHTRITVSTGSPGERSAAEVWDVDPPELVLKVASTPFDIYAALIRWPARNGEWALLAGGDRNFIVDGAQELRVWAVEPPDESQQLLARLRLPLRGSENHCHCPEPAPPGRFEGRVVALTGTGPYQCDAVVLFDLPAQLPKEARRPVEHEVTRHVHPFPRRAVISVKWSRDGGLLIANTRPHLASDGEPAQPAPPLSTAIELMVLDSESLMVLSVHGGHYAFTTAQAPFILHVDVWADSDLLASGGEDRCVHVWHRRHGRQLQRLEGHSQPVNAVSWSEPFRTLASASDDYLVILWS